MCVQMKIACVGADVLFDSTHVSVCGCTCVHVYPCVCGWACVLGHVCAHVCMFICV